MGADLKRSRIRLDLAAFASATQHGLELFRLSSRTVPAAPALTDLEEQWLCLHGGVIYTAAKGGVEWAGEAAQCDHTSFYPSVQTSKYLLPNCQPLARTLPGKSPGTSLFPSSAYTAR